MGEISAAGPATVGRGANPNAAILIDMTMLGFAPDLRAWDMHIP